MSKSKNGNMPLFDEVEKVERNGLPDGWVWVKSNDLFSFVTSGSRGWAKYYADEGPVFLRIGNLDHASISLDLEKLQRVSPPDSAETKRTRVQSGDLLISVTADVGMVGMVPEGFETAHINQHIALSRPIQEINKKFLAWYLASEAGGQHQFKSLQRGATKAGLSLDDIRNIDVPVAPRKEQKRIVSKIEELFSDLDAGLSALERARANLRRYRASVLKSAVEGRLTQKWRSANPDVEPASELLARILRERRERWEQQQLATYESKGKKPPKNWQSKYKEPAAPDTANLPQLPEGWCWSTVPQVAESCLGKMLDKNKHIEGEKLPYLRNVNVRWRSVDITDLREMFFKPGDEDRFGLEPGDVLVCEGGEPGRAAVWRGQVENMRFQKAIHRVRCGAGLLPEYLVVVLESFAKSGLLERLFTGTTIKHFTGVSFAKMQLPFPPIEEQKRIVELTDATVAETMRCNDEISLNLKRSERLRQSILKSAFSGDLLTGDENHIEELANV